MKVPLLLLLLLSSFFSQAQCDDGSFHYAQTPPKLSFEGYTKGVFNGDSVFFFKNHEWRGCFLYNIPDSSAIDGKWVLLKAGNLDSLLMHVTYKNGVIDGTVICQKTSGLILEVSQFSNGKREGKQYQYSYSTCDLQEELNYTNGLQEGAQIRYWPSGGFRESNYSKGLRHGLIEEWYRNGTKEREANYVYGQKHGTQQSWHKNGVKWFEKNYVNGVKHGAFFSWDTNGVLTSYAAFENDKPIGTAFKFKNGLLLEQVTYFNGYDDLLFQEFYTLQTPPSKKSKTGSNSKIQTVLKREITVKDSLITEKNFYPNGKPANLEMKIYIEERDCKSIYHKTGKHLFWDENGELIRVQFYENDKLIKETEADN